MAPAVMASSATTVAPFQGLKSTAGLPVSRRSSAGLGSVSNGGRIRCMQVCRALIDMSFFVSASNSLTEHPQCI
uniref:Ribulose-1,5-bisphosphate carboxylase small subunit N-terminal domain-containing protein n=1 Tax=Aegilops tauschii subsp. strangulata TaxID=200361 RepID=A0A453AGE6_AEGTS